MSDSRLAASFDKMVIRLPDGLRDRFAELARANGRSANAEAIKAFEAWLDHGGEGFPAYARLPEGLRQRIEAAAGLNGRSLLDEIAARLADSFAPVAERHVEVEHISLRAEIRDAMHEAIEGLIADPEKLKALRGSPKQDDPAGS